MKFTGLRHDKIDLSEAQKAEEAHLKVRFAMHEFGPEQTARRRRKALAEADRRFRLSELQSCRRAPQPSRQQREALKIGRTVYPKPDFDAPPLSRKERNELELLRRLYPEPTRELSEDEREDINSDHPFRHALPEADGNFYSPDTVVIVDAATIERLAKAADGPPIAPASPGNAPATDPIPSGQAQKRP